MALDFLQEHSFEMGYKMSQNEIWGKYHWDDSLRFRFPRTPHKIFHLNYASTTSNLFTVGR